MRNLMELGASRMAIMLWPGSTKLYEALHVYSSTMQAKSFIWVFDNQWEIWEAGFERKERKIDEELRNTKTKT